MSEHWNIQINIQKVTREATAPAPRGLGADGEKRSVISVLDLKISADSEVGAYEKAQRMLTANRPDDVVITSDHLHRASCHGAIGELLCGFPSGSTIDF